MSITIIELVRRAQLELDKLEVSINRQMDEIEQLRARIELVRQAKLELDELEGLIDRQTYNEHRRADFDMPDDAELYIVLTAKNERQLSHALIAITRAVTGAQS